MQEPIVNTREEKHAEELMEQKMPIPAEWYKGDSFATVFFSASSVAIPEAERFVVKTVEEIMPRIKDPNLQEKARNIIHEETAHSRVHDAYNAYLAAQGFPIKKYENEIAWWTTFLHNHCSLLTRLALCATTEHFTACMSRQVLDTNLLEGEDVDERMDRVWTWHSLEELDHRSTVFDLYRAVGGTPFRRIWSALVASMLFVFMHNRCLLAFLHQKKLLSRLETWRSGVSFLLGKRGVYRHFVADWFKFFHPSFHPTSIPIRNTLQKQLHHYHIEDELISYFATR